MALTPNPLAPATVRAALTNGGRGFIALPAVASKLTNPTNSVIVTADGNLGLLLADGTDNDSQLIPVTAGMMYPLQALAVTANNTAGVLGVN